MTGLSASFPSIDLSQLRAPALVARLSFDECYAAILADFRARAPEFEAVLASDPAIKLLEACAYRETLLRAAMDDAARATMLAFARDGALEHLAALFGLHRLTIAPATETAAAIVETDDELRARVQLAPELLAGPGLTGGGYRAAALTVAPAIKDLAVLKRTGGQIDLVILGRDGDGLVASSIVSLVQSAFAGDAAEQLTDVVSVRSARILSYAPTITVHIRRGPDPELVRVAAEANVRAYCASRHRVGQPVFAQMLESVASVGGVERARVDIADVVPAADEAAWLAGLTVTVEVAA